MHSLFGFVTELIIVKHRESPACFSGWQGFSVSRGGGVELFLLACGCACLLGLVGAGGVCYVFFLCVCSFCVVVEKVVGLVWWGFSVSLGGWFC